MPVQRPVFRYAALALLFLITMAYEVRYMRDEFRSERVSVPSFNLDEAANIISSVNPAAAEAGLKAGDVLLEVNGIPYRGTALVAEAKSHANPGVPILLGVRSPAAASGSAGEHTVSLPVTARRPNAWDLAADVVLLELLPGLCIFLGFWVAFARPRDSRAWILLLLMMAFPRLLQTGESWGWGRGWSEAGILYDYLLKGSFPVAIFLFGRFFPEPFAKGTWGNLVWKVLQWCVVLPWLLWYLGYIVVILGEVRDYRSVAALWNLWKLPGNAINMFWFVLVGSFFVATGMKLRFSKSPDARRRLRFLCWGTAVAFAPLLGLVIYQIARSRPAPNWIAVLLLSVLPIFPLTLAYVIVVQKAMAVSVAVRQGMQYALAKNGLRILQGLLVAGAIAAAVSMAADPGRNRPQKITVIALGVTAVFIVRRMGGNLRTYVDRRFFREAYNAEQVLTELSEQVRSMVDLKSLLETVASRISETLHVPQIAVLLGAADSYQQAVALGYANLAPVAFRRDAGMAKVLQTRKEPAQVFLNDRDSWLYREEAIRAEERDKLAALHAELLLPLSSRDKLLGFISLGPKKSEEPYTGSDVRLLKSVAAQTGLALENAELVREVASQAAQRERLNREVEIAREVQERLFPQKPPAVAGLDYAGHCRPALGVGGDYYDFLALPQGRLGVAIGDVSGKGIAAALMMASLQASLRGEATRGPENLALAVANVNRLVFEASSESRYATFFYGQYDPATGQFDYVNAGHNPPLLFRRCQGQWTVIRLDVGGVVVGLLESFPYQQASITLAKGDILVAYTDGISEAMNGADEEWGEDCLIATIEQCDGLAAANLLQLVFSAADAFVNGHQQHDDMTMVVLRVQERPDGPSAARD